MADRVERQSPGDLKKKALARYNRQSEVSLPNPKIGLLDDVIDIADTRKRAMKEGFELRVVRIHFLHKPASLVCDGRRFGVARGVHGRVA